MSSSDEYYGRGGMRGGMGYGMRGGMGSGWGSKWGSGKKAAMKEKYMRWKNAHKNTLRPQAYDISDLYH